MIREMMDKNVKNPKENKSAMASLVLGPNRKPSDFAAKIEDVPKKAVISARAKVCLTSVLMGFKRLCRLTCGIDDQQAALRILDFPVMLE